MNLAIAFTRTLFMILSIFFMTIYMISGPLGVTPMNIVSGLLLGVLLGSLLIGFDLLFKRFNLRSFNIASLGLFLGFLMGKALVIIFSAILDISAASVHLSNQVIEVIEIALFLFGIYLGTIMTIRASDELSISIPFVRFTQTSQKKKDLIIDDSVLQDPRMIDLANSHIFDHHLILPRFLVKELYIQMESQDEKQKQKAKKKLEIVKKLEELPELHLRYSDTDFPEVKDITAKIIRLGRLMDANVITADITRVQMTAIEGINFINIHNLSNALKPLTQSGEQIKIKIQRYGKEPKQGVGYLDDGTMVVVNGGGDYVGETIEATVLSVKHTSSGRMIFCNAPDFDDQTDYEDDER